MAPTLKTVSEPPRQPRPSKPTRAARNPQEEAARLLRSPPVGSAVGDEPPAGIQQVKGGSSEGETLIVGQRLVRQVGPLFDLIRHTDTQMPLTAAIYGPWGSGKSTAMKWIDRMLTCWSTGNRDEYGNHKSEGQKLIDAGEMDKGEFVRVRTVWFDPWKYQDRDDVLRGIIAEIIRETIKVQNSDLATVTNAVRLFGGMLGKTFLAGLESVKVSAGGDEGKIEVQPDKVVRGVVEAFKEANHPERAFVNDLEETLSDWVRHTIPEDKRLVVFIDDLDRCQPQVALQVLEALKLYLRVPRTIFVVGVDRPVIASLVESMYDKHGVREADAHRYLAKMFQVEVTLDAETELAANFFGHVTEGHKAWAMLEPIPEAQTLIRSYILEHADRNPREIKRVFNGAMMAAVGELHHAGARNEHTEQSDGAVARCLARGAQRFLIRHRINSLYEREGQLASKSTVSGDEELHIKLSKERYAACGNAIGLPTFHDFLIELARLVQQCGFPSKAVLDKGTGSVEFHHEDEVYHDLAERDGFKTYVCLVADYWMPRILRLESQDSEPAEDELAGATGATPQPQVRSRDVDAERRDAAFWCRAILAGESDELRTIRDAVALAVNKKPEALTVEQLLSCKNLYLADTGVLDLGPLAGLAELQRLDLNGTDVSDLRPLSGLSRLQELYLNRTSVSDLTPLSGLSELQRLGLNGTGVAELDPLSKLSELQVLGLNESGVSDLAPLSGLPKMRELYLNRTSVSNLGPLIELLELQRLHLNRTSVSDLGPLAGLSQLQALGLNRTDVSELGPLSTLSQLQVLGLTGTGVLKLDPLNGLSGLRRLYLMNSRVPETEVHRLYAALPGCQIQA